jgi:hypothetical protein
VNSDPHDGFWNFEGNSGEPMTPWDEIFAGNKTPHSSEFVDRH